MREGRTTETGDTGQLEVEANLSRIGWGPVANTRRDLGTDIYAQVRDARGFDLGIIVGVQVKSGPTAFEDEKHSESGQLEGWWFYENGVEHFEDWVTHSVPHLLVLHDLDTRISYWVHVTADKVEITGEGAKILVPASQTVDRDHLEDLIVVAATQRVGLTFEGSAWAATARTVPPARRLRTAMIAPRLVAPHRNKGFRDAIEPEEAVALLVLCRMDDLAEFANRHRRVPSMEEALTHRDWRWRFFGALGSAVVRNEYTDLRDLISKTNKWDRRASASVALASFLVEEENYEEAIEVLAELKDHCSPVDHAWVLSQKARCMAEIGQVAEARASADDALRSLGSTFTDDATASAIRASAASLLYYTADIRNEDLGQALAAGDYAASWWRTQLQAWGLQNALGRTFRAELEDTTQRIGFEESGHNRLFASLLISTFSTDAGSWQHATKLLAMNIFSKGAISDDEASAALDDLRRVGAASEAGIATKYLWRWGSPVVLQSVLQKILDRRLTRLSAKASLATIEHGGDLATSSQADNLCDALLGILRDPAAFASRINPTFAISHYVCRALASVIGAASSTAHAAVIDYICDLRIEANSPLAYDIAVIARRLECDDLTQDQKLRLFEFASNLNDAVLSAELMRLTSQSESTTNEELLRRARDGDRDALGVIGDVRILTAAEARAYVEADQDRLKQIMSDAENGSYGFWNRDATHSLAIFGSWFEGLVDWEVLTRFLRHPLVAGEHKRTCCVALAHLSERLPEDARLLLQQAIPDIKDGPVEVLLGDPLGGAVVYLAAALGSFEDDGELLDRLVELLGGTVQQRADVAMLIGHMSRADLIPLCVGLTRDEHPDVRLAATTGLAIHVAKMGDAASSVALAALRAVTESSPTGVALRVVNAFQGPEVLANESQSRDSIAATLRGHPSAIVRRRASAATRARPTP